MLAGVQSPFCAEGMLSLSCKKHPEWLDQAVIKINGISYKFVELEQLSGLPSGHHTIECIYDNQWIFIKSVNIKPNQNNIVNVKFKPLKRVIQPRQSDIKPGKEGCSRPVPVTISFTPSHAKLWVKQIYPSRKDKFRPYQKQLSPGDYQIYASAEGYITSEIQKFSVPCKGYVTLDLNSLKKEYTSYQKRGYKLAIFPFHVDPKMAYISESDLTEKALYEITRSGIDFNKASITHSYYDFDSLRKHKPINFIKGRFNSDTISSFWTRPSFFSTTEPNVKTIKKMMKKIGADLVLTYVLDSITDIGGDHTLFDLTFSGYLIDARTGKTLKEEVKCEAQNPTDDFECLQTITKKLFSAL